MRGSIREGRRLLPHLPVQDLGGSRRPFGHGLISWPETFLEILELSVHAKNKMSCVELVRLSEPVGGPICSKVP